MQTLERDDTLPMSVQYGVFSQVKEGDEVVFWPGYSFDTPSIEPVEKVSTLQITVKGRKFRRTDGRLVGETTYSRYGDHVEPVTAERRQRVKDIIKGQIEAKKRGELLGKVTKQRMDFLTTQSLERIVAILEKDENNIRLAEYEKEKQGR